MGLSQIHELKKNEAEVLNLLRAGSKSAFEEIFRYYWKDMFRHAYSKLGSKEIAEEIVQDIFTNLWIRREELLITSLAYYLHTSVKNKVLNHIRSQITQQKYWEYYKRFLVSSNATEDIVYFNDLQETIEKSFSSVSDKAKIIFRLNRLEGYSVLEISKKLNISEKAVEYHITRVVKMLKTHLKNFR